MSKARIKYFTYLVYFSEFLAFAFLIWKFDALTSFEVGECIIFSTLIIVSLVLHFTPAIEEITDLLEEIKYK